MTDYAWLFSRNSDDPAVVLLEMAHESWAEPIRLAACDADVVSNGHTFSSAWFRAEVVNDNGETPRATLEIPNVSREIGQMALALESPPSVTLSVVALSDPDTVEYRATGLRFTGISINAVSVSGELSGTDYGVEPLGIIRVTPGRFPAIFR